MKQLFITILLLISLSGLSQNTQGEQEDNWAKTAFGPGYVKQDIAKYQSPILIKGSTFYFGNQALNVLSTSEDLKGLFSTGLLYPELIIGTCPDSVKQNGLFRCDSLSISNIEEIAFLNHSLTQKRLRFLIWRPGFANPQLCFIEIINEKSTAGMTLIEFINGAKLTFYKLGSILI